MVRVYGSLSSHERRVADAVRRCVDPIKPTLKAPGIKLLILKYDKPLSNFAFKSNLRRYNAVGLRESYVMGILERKVKAGPHTMLFSFQFIEVFSWDGRQCTQGRKYSCDGVA